MEALLEAVVFCIAEGFSEAYVMDLDVYGFGEVYKYLKRIDARRQMSNAGLFRVAMNATGKEYTTYMSAIDR
jgi:hypothetical protein